MRKCAKPLPKQVFVNTDKYSGQVRLQELPDGDTMIQNYSAGAL
jgi:hypothetical protein